jgi:hypothetical protein
MRGSSWVLMPVIDNLEMTKAALYDCLEQDVDAPRVLLVDNGSSPETRRGLETMVAGLASRHLILPLWHHPPLGGAPYGTLNASWNFGLEFCWRRGAEEVLVVNNDVRLAPWTYATLRMVLQEENALWVSAVGVKEEQYEEYCHRPNPSTFQELYAAGGLSKGGPDFSCFLISKACHQKYPFDENFTYYGDNDYHRHMKLGGDGDRIFSVNVPYLHYGSRTINRSPEVAEAYRAVFREHQERYVRKWGGLPGEEKWERPYEGERLKEAGLRRFFDARRLAQERGEVQAPVSITDVPDEAR